MTVKQEMGLVGSTLSGHNAFAGKLHDIIFWRLVVPQRKRYVRKSNRGFAALSNRLM